MAVYTENYNLILPEGADPYDVEDYNENFRAIDGAFSSVEDALAEIDTTLDSMTQKLDALAGKSSAAVKSIQTLDWSTKLGEETSKTFTINAVTPARCVVIVTRLKDTSTKYNISYTLAATSFTAKAHSGTSGEGRFLYQIVEFY